MRVSSPRPGNWLNFKWLCARRFAACQDLGDVIITVAVTLILVRQFVGFAHIPTIRATPAGHVNGVIYVFGYEPTNLIVALATIKDNFLAVLNLYLVTILLNVGNNGGDCFFARCRFRLGLRDMTANAFI